MFKELFKKAPASAVKKPKLGRRFFLKPNERVAFFAVIRASSQEVITFTSSPEQAKEYVDIMIREAFKAHYEAWAQLHDRDLADPSTWPAYCAINTSVDAAAREYVLQPVFYRLDQLSAIIRSVCYCLPVGASYEDEFEKQLFNDMKKREREVEVGKANSDQLKTLSDVVPYNIDDYENDPMYQRIIDDTITYLEDRFIEAGYLPPKDEEIPTKKKGRSKKGLDA